MSAPVKSALHLRNRNREPYNLDALVTKIPALRKHIITSKRGVLTVNFSEAKAVKLLNQGLLKHYYGINNWQFPDENLCPPIPGRADYIHYLADLLAESNKNNIPTGKKIRCLDIGTGASCIYPIIGAIEYDWSFVGTESNKTSVNSAREIVKSNPILKNQIEVRLQNDGSKIFSGVLRKDEKFSLSMCNPPFHSSQALALKGTHRKEKNLSYKRSNNTNSNFSGIHDELVFNGGEFEFIKLMITESKTYAKNCLWFTTLVSKNSNLKRLQFVLRKVAATEFKTITMATGNKVTRILAWTFHTKQDLEQWWNTLDG